MKSRILDFIEAVGTKTAYIECASPWENTEAEAQARCPHGSCRKFRPLPWARSVSCPQTLSFLGRPPGAAAVRFSFSVNEFLRCCELRKFSRSRGQCLFIRQQELTKVPSCAAQFSTSLPTKFGDDCPRRAAPGEPDAQGGALKSLLSTRQVERELVNQPARPIAGASDRNR